MAGGEARQSAAALPLQVDGSRVTFDKEAGLWTVGSPDGPDVVGRVLVSGACWALIDGCAWHVGSGHAIC